MTNPDVEGLVERLKNARVFVQDSLTNGHLSSGDVGNLMSARDEIDQALSSAQSLPGCAASPASEGARDLLGQAWGALNFILAFYEPGQRYLDTEAWKHAEAGGRRVHKAIREYLDASPADIAERIDLTRDELALAQAEAAGLREALRPFAAVANLMGPLVAANPERWTDDRPNSEFIPGGWPRWGDFKRASEALSAISDHGLGGRRSVFIRC